MAKGATGSIIEMMQSNGLTPVAMKMTHLTRRQAEGFYHVHKERPFFPSLVEFMCSGPVVLIVLEGDDAISRYRELMGATDSTQAAEGTIRKHFGTDIEKNAVHGSDAPETSAFETTYFFNALETFS